MAAQKASKPDELRDAIRIEQLRVTRANPRLQAALEESERITVQRRQIYTKEGNET